MPRDTITFRMEGAEIPFSDFAVTMDRLHDLLQILSRELAPGKAPVNWDIHDLHSGSAEITLMGVSTDERLVEQVVEGFFHIGSALSNSQTIRFSKTVRDKAEQLTSVLKGRVQAITFETDSDSASINELTQLPPAQKLYAIGELQGIVETITKRRQRKFVLYDSLFNRAVDCYFTQELEDSVRRIWGREVSITGRIGRDALDGHPIDVREIQDIRELEPPTEFDFSKAFGIMDLGDEPPEFLIRRLRDAE